MAEIGRAFLFGASVALAGRLGWAAAPQGAEPSPSAGATAAPEAAGDRPIVLALRGDELDASALRALLSEELARPVLLEQEPATGAIGGSITISYRRAARELTVTWDSGESTLTRVVTAPEEPERVLRESTLLAGNLARQQIDDLLPRAPAPPAPPAPEPAPAIAPPVLPPEPEVRPITAGIFYPLATHYGHAEVTSNLDLNLLYGRVGSVDGAQLGGVNVVHRANGPVPSMAGLQVGYLGNIVRGSVHGIQLGGLFDYAERDAEGVQLASLGNVTSGTLRGVQGAAAFNRAGALVGVQLALVNVAGDVDGVQLGLLNIARNVRGVSVGLLNIADDIDGLPLAPFSVTKSGGVHPVVWSGSSGLGNAGIKFSTRRTYTLLFGSYHRAFEREFVGGGFGVGGSIELGAGFRADVDAIGTYLVAPSLSRTIVLADPSTIDEYHEQLVQPRLRLSAAYRAAPHFGAFVGVAARGQIRSELGWEQVTVTLGPEIFGGLEL